MRVDEVLARPLMEMSYPKKKAEVIITGLEKEINNHLLKLMVLPETHRDRPHWRREVLNWLDEVMEIRLKPRDTTGSVKFYYNILFDEPFGGVEVANVAGRLRRLARNGYPIPPDLEIEPLVGRLDRFHRAFAQRCHEGSGEVEDLLNAL